MDLKILKEIPSWEWQEGTDKVFLDILTDDQAVCAAGNWAIDAAWSHISELVSAQVTDKELLLAAIDAVVGIRPQEAGVILVDLIDSDDEDIVDAAHEAMAMADALSGDDFDDDGYVH